MRAGHLQYLEKECGVHGLVVGFEARKLLCASGGRSARSRAGAERRKSGPPAAPARRQRRASRDARRASFVTEVFSEPRKPREFCFQPKPSFDRPHRPHEHGVALSVRKVLYGYGTHGVCILDPPQTSCHRNFLRCQAAVALTTPPHAAQSRRARTARVRHVLRRGAAAYGDAYQALLGARMQERTFLSRP